MKHPPLFRAGLVLGLGLGGLFDGIVLHQILGWHHMVCTTDTCQPASIAALQRQIVQDGYFDFTVWALTLAGVALLFRALRIQPMAWPGKLFVSSLLVGWGSFNFFEGLIDHQILGLHHVLPGHPHQLLYDLLFLASGLLLAAVGWALARAGGERASARPAGAAGPR